MYLLCFNNCDMHGADFSRLAHMDTVCRTAARNLGPLSAISPWLLNLMSGFPARSLFSTPSICGWPHCFCRLCHGRHSPGVIRSWPRSGVSDGVHNCKVLRGDECAPSRTRAGMVWGLGVRGPAVGRPGRAGSCWRVGERGCHRICLCPHAGRWVCTRGPQVWVWWRR